MRRPRWRELLLIVGFLLAIFLAIFFAHSSNAQASTSSTVPSRRTTRQQHPVVDTPRSACRLPKTALEAALRSVLERWFESGIPPPKHIGGTAAPHILLPTHQPAQPCPAASRVAGHCLFTTYVKSKYL
jgi:hypothetical protein